MIRIHRSGRLLPLLLLPFIVAAGFASAAAAEGSILDAPQLAARVNGGGFVFRGTASIRAGSYLEHHIWQFSPAGSVVGIGSVGHMWYYSGYTEQPLPTTSGRWNLNGNQICVWWTAKIDGTSLWLANNQRFDGCYDVLAAPGGRVSLVGPQIFNGTMEPAGAPDNRPVATVNRPKIR